MSEHRAAPHPLGACGDDGGANCPDCTRRLKAVAAPQFQPQVCERCGRDRVDAANRCWCGAKWAEMLNAPQERPTPIAPPECAWTLADEDASHYETSCGHAWQFMDGGPTENGMRFCAFCGSHLVVPTPAAEKCQHKLRREGERCSHGYYMGATCRPCILGCPECWDSYSGSAEFGPRPPAAEGQENKGMQR